MSSQALSDLALFAFVAVFAAWGWGGFIAGRRYGFDEGRQYEREQERQRKRRILLTDIELSKKRPLKVIKGERDA